MQKQWFESWFDTPYYHLLYKNRDDEEARNFLDLALERLPIHPPQAILDLACGKGRHAIYLAKKGFDVTGMDLSPANIQAASQHAHQHLRFEIQDMRHDLGRERFDAVFNLFTGFGYFETDAENFSVFANVYRALRPQGIFLFDYLNEPYVRNLPLAPAVFTIEGVQFRTEKEFRGRWVIKHIEVTDGGCVYHFSEQVAMYSKTEIEEQLSLAGFRPFLLWGDYPLGSYTQLSPRLILACTKSV